MKKIPTLFKRTFDAQHRKSIVNEVTPGMEWVLDGEGIATVKIDGTCCAIIDGRFYRRYDAKRGKTPPEGAIPCCEPDLVTGHWPAGPTFGERVISGARTCGRSSRRIVCQAGERTIDIPPGGCNAFLELQGYGSG